MFEIRCVVGERHLSKVLTLLAGMTVEPAVVLPIISGDVAGLPNGQAHVRGKISPVQIALAWLAEGRPKRVSTGQVRQVLESKGANTKSLSFTVMRLQKIGVLKKSKERAMYDVLTTQPKES